MFLRAFRAFRRSFAASFAFVGGGLSFNFRAYAGDVDENWRQNCWEHDGKEFNERDTSWWLGKWLLERRKMLKSVEDMVSKIFLL